MLVAKLRWQGRESAGHTTTIVRSREREMCGAHLLVCAQLRFSTHMVQDPLPKEWRCRQWPRPSHISYLLRQPHPRKDRPTGQPSVDNPSLMLS